VRHYQRAVLLIPLVSWVAPANVGESGFLVPSLKRCWQRWSWCPRFVVADLAYVGGAAKGYCRQRWDTAVLTHRRGDLSLVAPFETKTQVACPQGQPLRWLGYDRPEQEHWFGVREPTTLCACCWEAPNCPREFVYGAQTQETLLGRLPLNTRAAQALLRAVRPWIEPAQSFEKNQLGLSKMFLNSLRFTWCMGLLADAVSLLRALALCSQTLPPKALLGQLAAHQMALDLT
jgi:hypothetical protein